MIWRFCYLLHVSCYLINSELPEIFFMQNQITSVSLIFQILDFIVYCYLFIHSKNIPNRCDTELNKRPLLLKSKELKFLQKRENKEKSMIDDHMINALKEDEECFMEVL